MRWKSGRRSSNVEDRRGQSTGRGLGRGGGLRMGRGAAVGGVGGVGLLVVIVIAMLFGVDPMQLLQQAPSSQVPSSYTTGPAQPGADSEQADFVSVVLADTEDTWRGLFSRMGRRYQDPVLVLFRGQTRSACGMGSAAMGPFYCPADSKVYIDLVFFEQLRHRFRAPGDFAQAYVIAHEIGHHVQNQLGISGKIHDLQRRGSKAEANALSVRLELQADCLAGVWAYHADRSRHVLETGDLEEALNAASAIGDDRLQKQARGYIVPDSFTHGSSAQRQRWFRQGYATGDPDTCDTFSIERP